MGQIYEDHRDEDGFLYIAYSGENTFGDSQDSQQAPVYQLSQLLD